MSLTEQQYFDRLVQEQLDLMDRLTKARAFRDDARFGLISPTQRSLIHIQINAMATYNAALLARIEHWTLNA